MNIPLLWYLDPAKPYMLFTDAIKYAWAGVLTQPYDEIDESNPVTHWEEGYKDHQSPHHLCEWLVPK